MHLYFRLCLKINIIFKEYLCNFNFYCVHNFVNDEKTCCTLYLSGDRKFWIEISFSKLWFFLINLDETKASKYYESSKPHLPKVSLKKRNLKSSQTRIKTRLTFIFNWQIQGAVSISKQKTKQLNRSSFGLPVWFFLKFET